MVGRRLVPQLVARGHEVTATTTSPAKMTMLGGLGADGVVRTDWTRRRCTRPSLTPVRTPSVHQMTAIAPQHAGKPDIKHIDRWFAPTSRLPTEGTDHLLAAPMRSAWLMSWPSALPSPSMPPEHQGQSLG